MNYVIIGAGAAGIAAAAEIRRQQEDAEIVMIAQEEQVHSRCMLHKYISRERNEEGLDFTEKDFFEKYRIQKITGKAASIRIAEKIVSMVSGDLIWYDKLLIATGAESFIPPIGNLREAGNVFGLRHLSDAQKIDRMAEDIENVVIIGSGLVGMDAAYGLLERGKNISVIEMSHRILPVQLDAHAAGTYQRLFENAGVEFYLGRRVDRTVLRAGGNIRKVILDTGEHIDCDMVIVAAGVRPSIDFLANSGIEADRSIIVDHYLQTNQPDIYAAGDVNGLAGIWPNAVKQGITAARNMCGLKEQYTDTFSQKNMMSFFGLPTLYLGQICTRKDETVVSQEDSRVYRRVSIRNGKVTGVLLQGDITDAGVWQYLIKNEISIENMKKDIFHITFADFYGTKKNGEYMWKS